jgi:hypothetical protein
MSAIQNIIQKALDSDNGALIGRNGTIELEQMIQLNHASLQILERNAGVFPIAIHNHFYSWQKASIEATQAADVLATGWYEPLKKAEAEALIKWDVKAIEVPLRALEPYYELEEHQWSRLLAGHKVAVVTSFTKTAREQMKKGASAIWGSKGVLPPNVDWHWIQTGYPSQVAKGNREVEWPLGTNSWSHAAEYVVGEVMKSGARFALIGCGGLGMPIAKMLKDRGVIAIVMGGAIQILFGIKGRRWSEHPIISKFWNSEWVWPSDEETPGGSSAIEGGCYWGKS